MQRIKVKPTTSIDQPTRVRDYQHTQRIVDTVDQLRKEQKANSFMQGKGKQELRI